MRFLDPGSGITSRIRNTGCKGVTSHIIDVVWLYRSPIPVGRKGVLPQSNGKVPLSYFSTFVYRESSHRRKSAACTKFDMVWLHRSPIPAGRRGGNFLVHTISICLRYTERKGEGNRHPVVFTILVHSVADPDPGSGIGAFLTPGSGIRNRFIPDPGSRFPNSYF